MRASEGLLEDLEKRIDAAVEEELREEWLLFSRGRWPDPYFRPQRRRSSPPLAEWPRVSVNAALKDEDAMLCRQFAACSGSLAEGDGNLLSVRCNYGTGILPSLFGAEPFFMEEQMDTLPAVRPFDSEDAVEKILEPGVPNLDSGWGRRVFSMAARFRKIAAEYPKIGRYVTVYHPDLQGPMDVCELLLGSRLFLLVYDRPKLLKKLLDLVARTYIAFMEQWLTIFPYTPPCSVHWSMMHRGAIMLRDDSATNFSPADFERFIEPWNRRLLAAFDGGAEHFCGRGDHFIASLGRMESLNAVHISQPELNDMDVILENTVDRGIPLLGLPVEVTRGLADSGRDLRGLVHCR